MFKEQLKNEKVYRIPLRHFSAISKVSFPTKIDRRIKLFLETNTDKLFESRKVLIQPYQTLMLKLYSPFIQYEQILLNKNLRQHLEKIMVSKKILEMGAQKTLIHKTYEINTGSDSLNV